MSSITSLNGRNCWYFGHSSRVSVTSSKPEALYAPAIISSHLRGGMWLGPIRPSSSLLDDVLGQGRRSGTGRKGACLRSCKYHLKIPTKQGVSRTQIDTHSFKCVWGPRTAGPCQTSQGRKTAGSPWRGIQPDRQVQWAEGNEALKSIWRMSCRIRSGPQRARWSITTWTSPRPGLNDAGRISFAVPRNAACIKEIAIGRPSSWASAAEDSMDNIDGGAYVWRKLLLTQRCVGRTFFRTCFRLRIHLWNRLS